MEKSCLSDSEKKQVMDMLYKYKDAFSLRDEIGTYLKLLVQIDVIDKSHSLLGHIIIRRTIKIYWTRK